MSAVASQEGKEGQGRAAQGIARQIKEGEVRQKTGRRSKARHSKAEEGKGMMGKAGQGKAKTGKGKRCEMEAMVRICHDPQLAQVTTRVCCGCMPPFITLWHHSFVIRSFYFY